MYSAPLPASSSMNGMGGSMIDGSGTINPAALNTPVSVLPTPSSVNAHINSRGQKRSRSPEQSGDHFGGGAEDDDQKPKKRGRPPKSKPSAESPASPSSQQAIHNNPDQLRTPQLQSHGLPQDVSSAPTQKSPPKPTPTKTVIKALPTVRDHTTDQLTSEGDEYIPREYDPAGEAKVNAQGWPQGGRQFKIRTFYVAHRREKRFMLATECARVLGYRDSYLLFNKNRSLFKIIASQTEKDELIHQEILPYSYRSRQIAIVTAKSMFRQFGARVIENGRRVRDDYWEAKAIKQGFTEEDMAGDKRPGAGKAREAASALENNNPVDTGGPGQHQEIIYADPTMESPNLPHGYLGGLPPLTEDSRLRAYGTIQRPRQEMGGPAYQDKTQTSPITDVLHQSSNAAENNKNFTQQRGNRGKIMADLWNRERETPVSSPPGIDQSPMTAQSPHLPSSTMRNTPQSMLQHQASQMMSPQQAYSHQHQQHHQNPHTQSPVRSGMPPSMRPDLQQHRSSVSSSYSGHGQQTSQYGGYPPQSQMWGHPPPHPQPQQSPLSSHHTTLPQYSPSSHHQPAPQLQQQQQQQQQPQQPQQQPQPPPQQQQQQQQQQPPPPQSQPQPQPQSQPHHHHPSQSPHPQQAHPQPQLHHSQSSSSMQGGANYQTMPGMPGGPGGYSQAAAMGGVRAMYPPQSASPSQQQYMHQQTTAAQQVGMQGWAPPPQQQQQQQWGHQPGGQGYPASTGY